MVFVGNINQSVDVLLKTSHLFEPFPVTMAYDTAFLDRMHCYIPGWEIPKYRPEFFTNDYGFITDYLSEFMREMRKEPFGDACDKYFRFGTNLNQRDTIAVRKMVSGFTKLLYPDGVFTKDEIEEVVAISLEMRRRVKEQLKKIGGMEFYDVNFSYIDNETFEEHYDNVAAAMIAVLNIGARGFNDGLFFDASAIEPQQIRIVFEKIFTATDQIQHYNMMMNVR